MPKAVYFISDLHLGATYLSDSLAYERRVVEWLKSIQDDVDHLYLLGDILDYWYEYRNVVPRGYVRFLGQLATMSDAGIKITWFIGNHDIWIFDYLPREIGVEVVDGSMVTEILGKRFYMAHGDGVGKLSCGFRMMRSIFRNKFCQWLYASIHPRWTIPFAHRWSSQSRNYSSERPVFKGPDQEPFVEYAEEYQKTHTQEPIDYFVFGHQHIMLQYPLSAGGELIVMGDWIHHFSYGRWDGKEFKLECYNSKMTV